MISFPLPAPLHIKKRFSPKPDMHQPSYPNSFPSIYTSKWPLGAQTIVKTRSTRTKEAQLSNITNIIKFDPSPSLP